MIKGRSPRVLKNNLGDSVFGRERSVFGKENIWSLGSYWFRFSFLRREKHTWVSHSLFWKPGIIIMICGGQILRWLCNPLILMFTFLYYILIFRVGKIWEMLLISKMWQRWWDVKLVSVLHYIRCHLERLTVFLSFWLWSVHFVRVPMGGSTWQVNVNGLYKLRICLSW